MKRIVVCAGLLAIFSAALSTQPRPTRADERSERLAEYLRTGRYGDASRLIDEMLASEARDDLKNVRAVFGSGPNMRVRRGSSSLKCEVGATGVLLPLTVNARAVRWLVDTGANVSMISDAEAARLGLDIRDSQGKAADLAGGTASVRRAVAPRMVIGRTQLEHVPFLVTPASEMPWKELPPGKQGILGLPVAIALDALQWTATGTCRTGSLAKAGASTRPPNMRYERLHVVADAEFDRDRLEFILDTGNQAGTQLWGRFGTDYEPLVKERGRKSSVRVTQIGGAADREVLVIPGVRLTVGGKETVLEGKLFSKPVGNDRFHGLLGMDVLSQAEAVTIDFRSMTLTLQ